MRDGKSRLVRLVRIAAGLLVIVFEFTNLFTFLAEGGNGSTAHQHSRYSLQFALYGVCFLIVLLDHASFKRIFEKPIVRWVGAFLALLTWAMIVRTFNSPAGINDYDFLREFGVGVINVGFLLSCVLIFDDQYVLY